MLGRPEAGETAEGVARHAHSARTLDEVHAHHPGDATPEEELPRLERRLERALAVLAFEVAARGDADEASHRDAPLEGRRRGRADAADRRGHAVTGTSLSSTRRFCSRPSDVSFVATGSRSPRPFGTRRIRFTCCAPRYSATDSARRSESSWL